MGIKTRGRSNKNKKGINKNSRNSNKTAPRRLFEAVECFEQAKGFLDKNGSGGVSKCKKKIEIGVILLGNSGDKNRCRKTQALVDMYLIGTIGKEELKQELSSL